MRKIILSAIGLGVWGVVFAAPSLVEDFPYRKDILISKVNTSTTVKLELDQDVVQAVNERFQNITVTDRDNNHVPFKAYFQDPGVITGLQTVEVSSTKEGKIEYLTDDNILTKYAFDKAVDGVQPAWVVIDLGQTVPLSRMRIAANEQSRIKYLEVYAGTSIDNLKRVVTKRSFKWQTDFRTDPVRYVKVLLTGNNIRVDDIKFYSGWSGVVYFDAEPSEHYVLLYGGTLANKIHYTERLGAEVDGELMGQLGRQIDNPLFPKDGDGDGLDNDVDNCPFVSNPNQKDSDEDRVGNACDNAEDVKNLNQYDTDRDGIGDVIDNCKLIPNPDQKNRDGDEYGDACDDAHAKEPVSADTLLEAIPFPAWYIWGTVLGLLVLGVVVFLLKKKFGKKRR